jgi:hypothetical protein
MILTDMPAEDYHAHPAIGSTTAKLALTSMRLLRDRLDGIAENPDKPCYQVGRLAHMMALEPERFAACIVDQGPINERYGKPYGRDTKAFAEWQEANPDKVVVEPALRLMIARMPQGIKSLIASGFCEQSIFAESCGVAMKCRPDLAAGANDYDLKTIESFGRPDADGSFPAIIKAIHRHDYPFSAGWYRQVQAADGQGWRPFHWIFAEKQPPHRWIIVRATDALLSYADEQAEKVLTRIADAQNSGNWDDPVLESMDADVPPWLGSDPTLNDDGSIDL